MNNANIISKDSSIYISDDTTLQNIYGGVGIKVPSFDKITGGNSLLCKVSIKLYPSDKSQCVYPWNNTF